MTVTPDRVTAVVLNWRTPELTERAVAALVGDGLPPERIVAVDNGSDDGSADLLTASLSGSSIVRLPENLGFAEGNNAGARHLPADAYLFVNSDAFVHREASLGRMLERLEQAALVVPRLVNEDLTLQRNVVPPTSLAVELLRASGASRFLPSPRWSTRWNHADAREIACAIGAVVLVRADAWADLGGFDERRFMYAEDLDLFWRARQRGWPIWFEPEAEFVHLGGATTSRSWNATDRGARVARSEAEMIRAHMGSVTGRATLAVMATGTGARAVAYALAGRRQRARELAAFTRGYLS